jgi:hypothetical protein
MNSDLIFELVELAVSLAHSQLDSGDVAPTLLDIATQAVAAYRDHTGEPVHPDMIGIEETL